MQPLENFVKFEVGARFPWEKYIGIGEKCLPVLNPTSFDIVVSFIDPTSEEIKTFRKGMLEFGLFNYKNVPLIYLDFQSYTLDVALNINNFLSQEKIDNWLNAKSNIINLFLIDNSTGILSAQRLISINFMEDIRDILEKETQYTQEETEKLIIEASHLFTIQQMQKGAIKKMFFKR